MASVCFGYTTVPFYDTLGFDTISYILKQTNLITICCDKNGLEKVLQTEDTGNL